MIQSAKLTIWGSKDSLFGGALTNGMSMEDAMRIVDKLQEMLFKGQDLSCINLADFGIQCAPEDTEGILCKVVTTLLQSQSALGDRLTSVLKYVQQVQMAATNITDERVKASKTSATSKYLIDALSGAAGKIIYDAINDQVKIVGLTPVGARQFINPSRFPDFDGSGKGKVGTDLEGWYLRNGQNGMDNALGFFPMYTGAVADAGKKGGVASFVVDQTNMNPFQLQLAGQIQPALGPTTISVPYNSVHKCFGVGGCRDVVIPDDGVSGNKLSQPVDLTHTHQHNLSAALVNDNPVPIAMVPSHIKELPIEFKGI